MKKRPESLSETETVLLEACKAALALFDKDHALAKFDWFDSALRAQDIVELNELPFKLWSAIQQAEKR